jgi:hypothetical protein
MVLKPFTIKFDKVEDVLPIYIKLEHDPGTFSSSKFIGDVSITDFKTIF